MLNVAKKVKNVSPVNKTGNIEAAGKYVSEKTINIRFSGAAITSKASGIVNIQRNLIVWRIYETVISLLLCAIDFDKDGSSAEIKPRKIKKGVLAKALAQA